MRSVPLSNRKLDSTSTDRSTSPRMRTVWWCFILESFRRFYEQPSLWCDITTSGISVRIRVACLLSVEFHRFDSCYDMLLIIISYWFYPVFKLCTSAESLVVVDCFTKCTTLPVVSTIYLLPLSQTPSNAGFGTRLEAHVRECRTERFEKSFVIYILYNFSLYVNCSFLVFCIQCIHNCFKPFLQVSILFSPRAANKRIFIFKKTVLVGAVDSALGL